MKTRKLVIHLGSIALVRYGRYLKDILDISRVNYLLVSKI